ncbi:MAG: dihydrofolate reductase [Candidatus Paceibacterota bacterium]
MIRSLRQWLSSWLRKHPRVSIIAAIGKQRELGKQGDLIWRVSSDLKRVKALTTGHPIIMGRKTYDSIGRPLPNRTNIVVSRNVKEIEGCIVVSSVPEALTYARSVEKDEIFIFGGAQIYEAAMPHTDRLYLTLIDATDTDADTFFPDYSAFTAVLQEESGAENGISFQWLTLEKPGAI